MLVKGKPHKTSLVVHLLAIISLLAMAFPVNADTEAQSGRTYLVGYAQDTMANDWRAAQVKELQEEFKKYPDIKFIYTDAKGQTAKQIQDIEDLAYKKVDVLMTSPRDAVLSTPAISKVYKSGIPVVLITRGIKSGDYTTLVAPEDYVIAQDAARYMAQQLKKQGKILVLTGVPTATTAIARTDGFMNEIKNYPGIEVSAIKNGNYLRADAIKAIGSVLAEGIKFDAIYAQSDSMASGARIALKKAGINTADILIVGIDYINEAREAIRKGEQTASFLYPTSAKQAVDAVRSILQGKPVAKRIKVASDLITKNNVDKIKPIF